MLAERWIWKPKPGCNDEFIKLYQAEMQRNPRIPVRLYFCGTLSNFGPMGCVVWEGEFETMEQRNKFWAEWWSQSESQAFTTKAFELAENVGHELWNLV